jgi:hypothetical protein
MLGGSCDRERVGRFAAPRNSIDRGGALSVKWADYSFGAPFD